VSELAAIRAFVAVVEHEGFSAAARRLGSSPSTISRQVTELEDRLGVRLLHRTTRRLSLTEAGEVYAERAHRIIAAVDDAAVAVTAPEGELAGQLRLTAPASIARLHLVPAIAAFHQEHPGVRVAMLITDRVVDLVGEGLDLAIRIGRPRDSSLVARKIGETRRSLCASPDYLARVGRPRKPEDLENHSCLAFRSTLGPTAWRFESGSRRVDVRVQGPLVTLDGGALVTAAVAGMGIVLVPEWLTADALDRGELVRLLPRSKPVPASTPLYALMPHRQAPTKVRVFVEFVQAWLRGSAP